MQHRFLLAPAVALLLAAPAAAQSLIANPNFDFGLSGWEAGPGTTWNGSRDAGGSPSSGSAQGNVDFASPFEVDAIVSQCIPMTEPGAQLLLGGKVFIPGGQEGAGGVDLSLDFFASPSCAGSPIPFNTVRTPLVTATDHWTNTAVSVPALGQSAMLWAFARASSLGRFSASVDSLSLQSEPTCRSDHHTLCLGASRFKVTATFDAGHGNAGDAGDAGVESLSPTTGYLWFFDAANVEMIVKVIDGCGLGGHHWFFASGMTDVQVTITVTDVVTGMVKTYTHPAGHVFEPILDTSAFPCS